MVGGPTVEAATTTLAATHAATHAAAAKAPTTTLALLTGHAAVLAAAGLVVKPLLSKELLLAGSELEARPTVTALEINILVGHVDEEELRKGKADVSLTTLRPCTGSLAHLLPGPSTGSRPPT